MLRRKAIKKCASNSWRTCAACTTRIECTPTEIDLELARHACTPWAPWSSIFAPHDVRSQSWGSRAIDVINRQGTCAACTTRIECTPTEIDLELARHACTPWAPWPSIFAPHDVRSQSWGSRAIDVINRQGKYAPSAALCARYICSTPVSFRMESRTPMGHNLILRRASEEGPPEALKTDEQKFRSLRAPDIYWSKPPYEHLIQ
jgi:hypothetical protein